MSEIIASTTNLEKVYSPGQHNEVKALKGVTTEFHAGEFVAVIGPSGSGKSTFMHLLGVLDLPSAGDVVIAGKSVKEMSENERADLRAKELGFIFQGYNLLSTLTALENVVLAGDYAGLSMGTAQARAKQLLQEVGLGERYDHQPSELSGGEQQRVAIARSLMNDGRMILADEPTGELDSNTSLEIINTLKKLNQEHNQTFVIVTHNDEVAKACKAILHVKDGRNA